MAVRERRTEFLPEAVKLAREMRAGLSASLSLGNEGGPPGPFAGGADVRRYLETYSNTLAYTPEPGSKPLARITWLVRRVWRKLLAPWLCMQSHFNEATIAVVEQLMTMLHRERARRILLEERVRDLEETRALVEPFREPRDRQGHPAAPAASEQEQGSSVATIAEPILENMFLCTRLPPPPARLLALVGDTSANAVKLSSLGFEVVRVDVRTRTPLLPAALDLWGHLPFEDNSFDAVVNLSAVVAEGPARRSEPGSQEESRLQEIFRVLRPGGKLLWTAPLAREGGPQVMRQLPAWFRIVEQVYAVRDGDLWRFAPEAGEGNVVHLLVAEKA